MPGLIQPAATPRQIARLATAERFRLAAERVQARGDHWAHPPLKTASAWTTGEVIPYNGVVRANGGNWYAALGTGTCGATAPTGTVSYHNDGGVTWTWIGVAENTADDVTAPAVTIQTGAFVGYTRVDPVTGTTNAKAPLKYALRGGYLPNPSANTTVKTMDTKAGTTVAKHHSWEFETDAESIVLHFTYLSTVQIVIDGRRLAPGGINSGTAGSGESYVKLDFVGGRKTRRVQIVTAYAPPTFRGCYVKPALDMVWAPATVAPIKAAFIADSILDGSSYGPTLPGGYVADRMGTALGWADCWDFSIGGTGYIATGASSYYTYAQRIPEIMSRVNPDVWVLMGSTNDGGSSSAAITAAALACYQAIRAVSSAPVIVMGVWPINAGALTVETAVKAAFDAWADPRSWFIPIANPADGQPWVLGAWNNTGNWASFTSPSILIADGTHPSDAGLAYLARRAVQAIRAGVLPNL